jgi:hypothetical protein
MTDASFCPGYGFVMGMCLKECANRGWKCKGCYGFSKLKEKTMKKKRKKQKRIILDGCSINEPPKSMEIISSLPPKHQLQ